MPKVTAQRIAIVCLVLAAFDAFAGQKILAIAFAVAAIAISLGAGWFDRSKRKNRKGR